MSSRLDHFILSYIEALLWSSHSDVTDFDGLSYEDLSDEALLSIKKDCEAFFEAHNGLFTLGNCARAHSGSATEQAGHDFALTRNGHGAGFWDGDWEEPAASILTKASEKFGESSPYIGDDGKIYLMEG